MASGRRSFYRTHLTSGSRFVRHLENTCSAVSEGTCGCELAEDALPAILLRLPLEAVPVGDSTSEPVGNEPPFPGAFDELIEQTHVMPGDTVTNHCVELIEYCLAVFRRAVSNQLSCRRQTPLRQAFRLMDFH